MNGALVLSDLKSTHDELYQRVLNEHVALLRDQDRLEEFIAKVDEFLGDLNRISSKLTAVDDYDWLTDVILKWQIVYSSVLNIPRNLTVPPPPPALQASPIVNFYSEEELDRRYRDAAFQRSLTRRRNRLLRENNLIVELLHSSGEEMDADMYDAGVILASRVLEGEVRLPQQLSFRSYWRLESVWLSDVKAAKAYFTWEKDGGSHDDNYFRTCEEIRQNLVDPKIKAPIELFDEARMYLVDRYLSRELFDPMKPESQELLRRKAYRIHKSTGERDEKRNWMHAIDYCHLFYDNILPAVIQGDPERTLLTLKAFQLSKAPENRYLIINCFEVALAIYFLDPEVIRGIWMSSEGLPDPEGVKISSAFDAGWPANEPLPEGMDSRLMFDPERGRVVFEGVMRESDRKALVRRFPDHSPAIEAMFRESRLLSRESTL